MKLKKESKNYQVVSIPILEKVLGPVIEALVPMTVDIQQSVSRIIIKTFCEAWLEHIKNKKIKFRYTIFKEGKCVRSINYVIKWIIFSDYGATQISLDFTSLRTWISKNENLKEDSRQGRIFLLKIV